MKHYVCPDKPNRTPMYFYFVGMLRNWNGEEVVEAPVIQCEWGTRLRVNVEFLRWLERCDEGEVGRIKTNKKIVKPEVKVVVPPKKAEQKEKALAAAASPSPDSVAQQVRQQAWRSWRENWGR